MNRHPFCLTTAWLFLAGALLALCGCRPPAVSFPVESLDAAARRADAAAAYDTDNDGKADAFLLANPAGRVVRLGYDTTGDEWPDVQVPLDAPATRETRHLVLILDGFSHDVVSEYYRAGGLRMFHRPSRVIAPYPSMTDLCLEDVLGYTPCPGMEARWFNRRANRLEGGSMAYLKGVNEPYNHLLQYRANLLWDAIGYVAPWKVFVKETHDAKRLFDRRRTQEVLCYFVSSAGVSTRDGQAGQLRCLRRVDLFCRQVLFETRGRTRITILSDHGHSYTPPKHIDFATELRKRHWQVGDTLTGPRSVVPIPFGVVTYAGFATNAPGKLAAELVKVPGVELASHAWKDRVVVLSADGGEAWVCRKGNRYRYGPVRGDPLRLKAILAKVPHDEDGYAAADDLLAATADHAYPAPLQRLWRAHFALVENPPTVLVSLDDAHCAGLASFGGAVSIVSTHGSLNRRNSTAFICSTAGKLPPLLRSRDVPAAMAQLLQVPTWPTGR